MQAIGEAHVAFEAQEVVAEALQGGQEGIAFGLAGVFEGQGADLGWRRLAEGLAGAAVFQAGDDIPSTAAMADGDLGRGRVEAGEEALQSIEFGGADAVGLAEDQATGATTGVTNCRNWSGPIWLVIGSTRATTVQPASPLPRTMASTSRRYTSADTPISEPPLGA